MRVFGNLTISLTDAVWQLIALSTWVIEFTAKLMKACILASNAIVDSLEGSQSGMLYFVCMACFPLTSYLDSGLLGQPILLHLCHPFALQNFLAALNHVKAFRAFLAAMPAGSNNTQITQAVLVDTVDYSGVDFGSLISLLQASMEPVQKLEGEHLNRYVTFCVLSLEQLLSAEGLLQHVDRQA